MHRVGVQQYSRTKVNFSNTWDDAAVSCVNAVVLVRFAAVLVPGIRERHVRAILSNPILGGGVKGEGRAPSYNLKLAQTP